MRQWGQAVAPACPQMALGEIVTMRNISLLIKPVSGICNMVCEYCFYCDEAKKRTQHVYGMMNDKTLETIIEKTISEADDCSKLYLAGWRTYTSGYRFL